MTNTPPLTALQQFRDTVYQNFNKRADTLMDLLDALSSNTTARSVVELSLNPAFQRKYSALFTALDEWEPTAPGAKTLAQLAGPYLPQPTALPFWLLGVDVTPQPRVHAVTLTDRTYVYQPNAVKSNKPITIGHAYSTVVVLPETTAAQGPAWVVPVSVARVPSTDNKEVVGAQQLQALLADPSLPFHDQLCVEVVDSAYGKPTYLAHNRASANLVTIARARNTYTVYLPPTGEPTSAGHPTWYGAAFDLDDEATWPAPAETTTTVWTSASGQTYQVELQGWDDLLMHGKHKPVKCPMHLYPFRLVRVRVCKANGELAFHRPLWLIVMGPRRGDLTLVQIFDAYRRRFDLEHFFRFGKQRLLLTHYQTPDTSHEEKWWLLVHLAYLQLWVARPCAQTMPRPWETAVSTTRPLSPTQVQRDFGRIIRQIGTPATVPKPRGNSPGRPTGPRGPARPRRPVVYKGKT